MDRIFVTGAGGQLGGLVARELAARGAASRTTLGTRHPAAISGLAAEGFAVAAADFDDPAALEASFVGVGTVLLISADGPNDIRIRQHLGAIEAARKAGVGRVVYTSVINPSPASLFTFAAIHAATEQALKASGLAWTFLRNSFYAENLSAAIAQAKATGTLAQPGAAGRVTYIARADIAAATAGAVLGDGHANAAYDITGTEAVDLFAIGRLLGAALGRPIETVDADPAAYGAALAGFGLPPFLVEALLGLYAAAAAGEYTAVSGDAARLAGRPLEPIAAAIARIAA